MWLVSDVVMTADFRPLLHAADGRSMVVSQAPYWDLLQRGIWGSSSRC